MGSRQAVDDKRRGMNLRLRPHFGHVGLEEFTRQVAVGQRQVLGHCHGFRIKVRTLDQSLDAEGPYMNDAYGRAVPETEENQAQKLVDEAHIAELEANDPELAAYDAAARAADAAAQRQAGG